MIVCFCNVIREDEVREAAAEGLAHARSRLCQRSAASRMCGCCLDYAQELIDEERGEAPARCASSPDLT